MRDHKALERERDMMNHNGVERDERSQGSKGL